MSNIRSLQTNFTAGAIDPRLIARGDLRAYDNGALILDNVFIHPTGGISRRPGLAYVDTARGPGRLAAFEFNTEQTYLLVFSNLEVDIYLNDTIIASLDTPWAANQLKQLNWTQSADTLLICHPDVKPKKLTRSGSMGTWTLEDWSYLQEGAATRQPWYRFHNKSITLQASGLTGVVTLTASAPVFQPLHEGVRFRINGKQVRITSVASSTQATASVEEALTGITPVTNWDEQAFSELRGWPITAAFHQDRLVIGGSRSLPNRIWMSQIGDLWNFNLGAGLDDEAIEFAILSDQVNAIRALFSGRHLQVFTSGAEWMVTGDPLTPQTLQIHRQTRIGSLTDRIVSPRDVDGATLFVARNGVEIREFLYTDVEQAYQALDMALLARHLINQPVDMDFDQTRRVLMVVMQNGDLCALTSYRAEQVAAWTRLETGGNFRSVSVVGDVVYVLLERGPTWTIERLDDSLYLDSALSGESSTPSSVWSGLEHLEGQMVSVVADGVVRPPALVQAGAIVISPAASEVQAGLSFTHRIEPLPPNPLAGGGQGQARRPVMLKFLLESTSALTVDTGKGGRDIPLRKRPDALSPVSPAPYSGEVSLRLLGWSHRMDKPLWRIVQDLPLPFTLLSATLDMKVE